MFVGCGGTDVGVDHEEHGVGQIDGNLGLCGDGGVNALCVGLPSASVDECEVSLVPLRLVRDAVTRDARCVFDHSLATTKDSVHECRLTHVRATDHGQHG